MKSAGVNRGTTGEAMVVRNLATRSEQKNMSEAERLHGHLIGQQGSRRSLNTPALVLDLDMLDRNIAEMANFAKAHKVKLRPHSKTHKSADIAKRQIAAGALGVCCAKLGEAEALAEAGVESLHITSPVVTPQAIARLIALNGKVDGPDGRGRPSGQCRRAGRGGGEGRQAADGGRRHRSRHASHRRRHARRRGRAGAEGRRAEVAEICRRAVLLRPPPAHQRLQGAQGRRSRSAPSISRASSPSSRRRG